LAAADAAPDVKTAHRMAVAEPALLAQRPADPVEPFDGLRLRRIGQQQAGCEPPRIKPFDVGHVPPRLPVFAHGGKAVSRRGRAEIFWRSMSVWPTLARPRPRSSKAALTWRTSYDEDFEHFTQRGRWIDRAVGGDRPCRLPVGLRAQGAPPRNPYRGCC